MRIASLFAVVVSIALSTAAAHAGSVIDLSNSGGVSPGVADGAGASWEYSVSAPTYAFSGSYAEFEVSSSGLYDVTVTGPILAYFIGTSVGDGSVDFLIGPSQSTESLTSGVDYFVSLAAVYSAASGSISVAPVAASVPEPGSLVLFVSAITGVGVFMRRRAASVAATATV